MINDKINEKKYIYLRPGANVFKNSNDSLQIAFPNYTITFKTTLVVSTILEILEILPNQHNVQQIIDSIIEKKNINIEFATYIIDQLVSNRCAFFSIEEWIEKDENELIRFYQYVLDRTDIIESVSNTKLVLLTPEDNFKNCQTIFEICGLKPEIIPAVKGKTLKEYREEICNKINSNTKLIVSWNFPYRLPTANMINQICIETKTPVLFGACEGVIGKIGPYVIPLNSSCLECMHLRLNCNFDEYEKRSFANFRIFEDNKLYSSWLSHPNFQLALLQFFTLEINRIIMNLTPNCLGSYYEFSFGHLDTENHLILKVPNCPVCSTEKPSRFAWDYHSSAPVVKESN